MLEPTNVLNTVLVPISVCILNIIFWYWFILTYRYEITAILFYLYTYISLNIIGESPYNLLKILKLLVYISTYQFVRF